jgi:hypothetical protein
MVYTVLKYVSCYLAYLVVLDVHLFQTQATVAKITAPNISIYHTSHSQEIIFLCNFIRSSYQQKFQM